MKDFKTNRNERLSPAVRPPVLALLLAFGLACGTVQESTREPFEKTPVGDADEAAAAHEPVADAQADPAVEAAWQGDGEGGESGPADGVQAASPDAQAESPEEAIPETTLEALRQGSEAPGFVNVKAYFVETINPSPCPPKHLCEPCTTVTIISDNPDVKDADSKEGILVEGYPQNPGKMKHGKLYTFTLELGEDYVKHINVKECDPRIIKVWLSDCVDCPKKGKGKGKGKGEGKGKLKKHIEIEF